MPESMRAVYATYFYLFHTDLSVAHFVYEYWLDKIKETLGERNEQEIS